MWSKKVLGRKAIAPVPPLLRSAAKSSFRCGCRIGGSHRRQLVPSELPAQTDGSVYGLSRIQHQTKHMNIMKKQIVGFILTSAVAVTISGCATFSDPAAWEYKAEVPGPGMISNDINHYEQQGWKLISMKPIVDSNNNANVILLFKRHK